MGEEKGFSGDKIREVYRKYPQQVDLWRQKAGGLGLGGKDWRVVARGCRISF